MIMPNSLTLNFFFLISLPVITFSAEEEFRLLLLESNLIAEIEIQQADDNPEKIINSYYGLLDKDAQSRINFHRTELISLSPRYEVAYEAADSAELAELMDKISFHWGTIKNLHAQYFVRDVQVLLSTAYDQQLANNLATPILE